MLEELNAGFGDALDIKFEPLGWEDTLASTGRRSQEVINRDSVCSRNPEISVVCRAISEVSRLRLQKQLHRALARWQKKRRGKPQAPETEPAQAAAFGAFHARHWLAISDWIFSNG